MKILYNIILFLAAFIILPYFFLKIIFTGKYRRSFLQKLGGRQGHLLANLKAGQRIWIHAVSVGEVTAAAPIVASLKINRPDAVVIFSTSTETGQAMAKKLISGADAFIYFPLDIPWVIRKMISLVRPDIFVMIETELWPNFLAICREQQVKTVMVNGRISPRSFRKYLPTRFFWGKFLGYLDEALMISEVDATRIQNIGMDKARIKVLGNAKYDALAAMAAPALQDEIATRFNIKKEAGVLVAGSTHAGEEEIIISVYRELLKLDPDFKLILVPRHIERTKDILGLLQQAGFDDIITVTQMNGGRKRTTEKVIVVDVIGELFKVYSLATFVYCGGSLVPKGGQNILEAAAWGKVIFYGPSMEDFSTEAALLEQAGAGIKISSGGKMLEKMMPLLKDPQTLAQKGEKGKAVVMANMGAAARYAEMIIRHLG